MLQLSDYLGLATIFIGVAAAVAAAYWNRSRKVSARAEASLVRRMTQELRLAERDRELLERITARFEEALRKHGIAIEDHARAGSVSRRR